MIDAAVLAAIERALEQGGGVEEARLALRRADPLIRGAAVRRLRAAHADAVLATAVKDGAHPLRLAYLGVARALPPGRERDDVAAVEAAYDAARAARPAGGGRWWATALAALGVAAAVGGLGIVLVHEARESRPATATERSDAAGTSTAGPAAGAFATGGVPEPVSGDAAIARALGVDLPAFLIALDRRTEARGRGAGERAAAEADLAGARSKLLLAPEVGEALGGEAARALGGVLGAALRAADAPFPGGEAGEGGALGEAVGALDDALAARGIGYFADGDVVDDTENGRRFVLVYTFRVERVSLFAAGDVKVRAVHLRRLDRLNWSHTLLGFTRPTLRAAVVLMDQLDEQVISLIAPALAQGAPVPVFEPGSAEEARAAVEARAGELVRAEYGGLPGLDAVAAGKLGKLLGRRRTLLARFRDVAAAQGMSLSVPATLRLPEGFAAQVGKLVPREEMRELLEIDAALEDRTRADAFAALRAALAASVERHEVQHRLDALRPGPPPMPAALEALVGSLARAGRENRLAATARAELSAYLAELARDAQAPHVGLTLLARFLFDQRLHGAPECYAALAVVEGLAGELGVGGGPPILRDGLVDRSAAARVYLALAALPVERLRGGAKALWEKLFGAPLPELRKLGPAEGARP